MEPVASIRLQLLFDTIGISPGASNEKLLAMGRVVSYQKGTALPLSGSEGPRLFLLLRGCTCCELETRDGRVVLECICYRYGTAANPIGMFTGAQDNEQCFCLQNSEFAVFPMEQVKSVMAQDVELLRIYSEMLTKALGEQTQHKLMLSLRSEEKYEWFLQHYAAIAAQIPMRIVAQFLNIDPATLSRIRRKRKEGEDALSQTAGEILQ